MQLISSVGMGNCFSFDLSFEKDKQTEGQPKVTIDKTIQKAEKNETLQALLIEDDEVNQEVIQKILNKLNVQTQIASNGQEALPLIQTKRYDIIFMDILMPIMDGYQAIEQIRNGAENLNTAAPIIALSAMAGSSNEESCLQAGMNDYISKPIQFKRLEQAVCKFR